MIIILAILNSSLAACIFYVVVRYMFGITNEVAIPMSIAVWLADITIQWLESKLKSMLGINSETKRPS